MAVKTSYLSAFSQKYREHGASTLQNLQNHPQRSREEGLRTQTLPPLPYKTYETSRWGPALDDAPPIIIPPDWRSEVAAWPHDRWKLWRDNVTKILDQEGRADVETINLAELTMYRALTPGDPTP
jgi:hypothetical protein